MERPFRAYDGDEPYVFVCYSHDDKALVYPEIARLRESGINVWYDEGITPGSEWSETLANHIERCAVFLYFVTPRAVVSEHCRREINFALEQPCGLLAVHLERTELPSGLKLTLSNRQAILKYDDPRDVYETKLTRAIQETQTDGFRGRATTGVLHVGDWTLDVGTHRLTRDGREQVLDAKAQSVLLHLVDKAPEVVSREGLMTRTWPDVVVGDNVLDQAVAQLRRALGDDARDPTYIETLPRRGYRLLAEVDGSDADRASTQRPEPAAGIAFRWPRGVQIAGIAGLLLVMAWWLWQPSPARDAIPTIAVLPFVNIGETEDYFSDGVTEEILNRMIRLRDVRVISRQSSFAYGSSTADIREIGAALGADYILEGSLRRSGDLVRIGVRLTDVRDGTEMWGNSYDRELTDILRLQDEIARAAISELVPTIASPRTAPPDVDPTAYDLLLKARAALAANDPPSAKPLLETALTLEPGFAEALGTLAVVLNVGRGYDSDLHVEDEALQGVVDRTLELDPDNIAALQVQIALDLRRDFDVQAALSATEALMSRFPNVPGYGYQGLLAIALQLPAMAPHSARVQALDPHSTVSAINAFSAHFALGEFDRARRDLDRIPMDAVGWDCFSGRVCWLLTLDLSIGRLDDVERNLARLEASSPYPPDQDPFVWIFKVWWAVERGQLDTAKAMSRKVPWVTMHNLPYFWLPLDVVITGEIARTLDEIETPTGANSLFWIMRLQFRDQWTARYGSPVFKDAFAALRQEPRYQRALVKYGIDDASLAKIELQRY